jgi:hypothetical protein
MVPDDDEPADALTRRAGEAIRAGDAEPITDEDLDDPERAIAKISRRRAQPRRRRESARDAVTRSGRSARNESRRWVPFKPYLPKGLSARMLRRLAIDQAASDTPTRLAGNHYLNAALERVPSDPGEAGEWALAWRARGEGWETPGPGPVPGSLAHKDTARAMHLLNTGLRGLDQPPRLWEVEAEALARLLDELDADDAARGD